MSFPFRNQYFEFRITMRYMLKTRRSCLLSGRPLRRVIQGQSKRRNQEKT